MEFMNTPKPSTILLVEDKTIIAMAEKKKLETLGYRIVHSSSGEKAIEIIQNRQNRIDLILIDIILDSGIDGLETAKTILQHMEIPVIFLTSQTSEEIVKKTESVTNYGCITGDSSNSILDASIKTAFNLFHAYQKISSRKKELEAANAGLISANKTLEKSQELLKKSETAIKNRLTAVLDPEADLSVLELSEIIDAQSIQSLMEDFHQLTGILGAILDIKGNILVAVGWQDICTKFHRCHPETNKHCIESDTQLTTGVPEGTYKLYRCKNNMWDMVTPLIINKKHVGNIFIGQFIFDDETPNMEFFRSQAEKYGFDEQEYMAALKKVPRLSRKTVETGMAFYAKVANIISTLSYRSIKLSRTITEREQAEKRIRSLLNEKELILKEVHHRIKNNLGTINALLSLQSHKLNDPMLKNILLDATSRLESMRILYDKLYLSDNFQKVSLKEYLKNLVEEIIEIFPITFKLEHILHIEEFQLDVNQISNIGIIVNELITNSIKYAFHNTREAVIQIDAMKTGSRINLSYSDNGSGIPESIDLENSSGFGMTLIKILTEEMHGTVSIDKKSGTKYIFEFQDN